MFLIDCEINIILNWSANHVIVPTAAPNQNVTIVITDTKPYVQVVTLSIKNNVKLWDQLKSGFKRTINWNKYQSKGSIQPQNHYLNYLIDASFKGVFILSFEDNAHKKVTINCRNKKKKSMLWLMEKTFLINQ